MVNRFLDMVRRPEAVLCLDIGNSRAKACIFQNGGPIREEADFAPEMAQRWRSEFKLYGACIGSVGGKEALYRDALSGMENVVVASSAMPLPFQNHYRSETLGVDRIAGVCGALLHHQGQACLVLDAGTCLTYDLLDAEAHYLGGAIAPGLAMRLKAMHTFTARLPLLSPADEAPLPGLTTEECMQSGALNGIRFEAEGFFRRLEAQHPGLSVLLTGGDGPALQPALPAAQYRPQLVLEGLLLLFWWQQHIKTN